MKSTQKKVSGADLPTPVYGFFFELKAWRLRVFRSLKNIFHRIYRYKPEQAWEKAQLLSQSISILWSGEETAKMLIAGKIHNLRLSIKYLDGIIIPAGQIFSFWKQTGRITRSRGYALGRELREGCIIPATGGGICQLSNAIYDAAIKAGLEIVERHRHSQIIAGSLAEQDRDATVFWNYLDLRLSAPFTWQLQVRMDDRHLSVSIWTQDRQTESPRLQQKQLHPHAIGDCTKCGRTDCYLHVGDIPLHEHKTWLVTEEEWPEFTLWRKQNYCKQDKIISTVSQTDGNNPSLDTRTVNLYSKLMRRYHLYRGHPLPVAQNSRYGRIAKHFAKKLKASDTYLIIPQDLLAWLWMTGELRGRQYDVLMNALPISEIQSRLDVAAELYPRIKPLTNFRADSVFEKAEHDALTHAQHWITPHAEILKSAGNKGIALPWMLPEYSESANSEKLITDGNTPKIMLAAPSLARKGVYELSEALRMFSLPVQLILPSNKLEAPDIWDGLKVKYSTMSDGIREADIVILPAWIEHQPRGLLQAIAYGKPVIATPACGLTDDLSWYSVEAGNVEALNQAITSAVQPKI